VRRLGARIGLGGQAVHGDPPERVAGQ
jgi:hypothetical protein